MDSNSRRQLQTRTSWSAVRWLTGPARHPTMAHGQAGLRSDRRRRRRHGLGGDLRAGAARPARARAGAVRHSARARVIGRRHAHLPLRLLRAPELRAAHAPVVRPLAGARARFRREAADRNRRPRHRPAEGARCQRSQGGVPGAWAGARGAARERRRAALSGLAAAARSSKPCTSPRPAFCPQTGPSLRT